ncbi:MAG: Galactose-1-phosphate uridylyltransferase [Parcubacteria group bacterium GW2011_GWB1_40_14]|nr:MAG: Galactose-1-phosphate uridylyltransferase [Parcubacteria group bacterium GW2011_GWB1_40_14]
MKKETSKKISELRRDPVTRDWIVIATGRGKRPNDFAGLKKAEIAYVSKKECPFEDPKAHGNSEPILILDRSGKEIKKDSPDWFVQVVPNKYPAFSGTAKQRHARYVGPYTVLDGTGFHEVVIMRDHDRSFDAISQAEAQSVISAYAIRFNNLSLRSTIHYVSIFHNFGKEAGASLYHPHSQIMAIPVVPPDVSKSLAGSKRYFEDHGKCVHCEMIAWEKKDGKRIVFENAYFIAFCPFVSRSAFEIRIFPKAHEPTFKNISMEEIGECAEALRNILTRISLALNKPAYNFFIHTSPIDLENEENRFYPHYHWHIEILPKTAIWAGFELGTGIEISTIEPETAAQFLRKFKT